MNNVTRLKWMPHAGCCQPPDEPGNNRTDKIRKIVRWGSFNRIQTGY